VVRSRDSSVAYWWATGWMIVGSSPGKGWEFFSSPPRPDRLWGPPSLSNRYKGLFSWGYSGRGVKLTIYLYLVSRPKMCEAIPSLPNTPSWCGAYLRKAGGQFSVLYMTVKCTYNCRNQRKLYERVRRTIGGWTRVDFASFGPPSTVNCVEVKYQVDKRIRDNRRLRINGTTSEMSMMKLKKCCKVVVSFNRKHFILLESRLL
jgi:hypothetical protein